jgi:hypothetical protein
MVNELPTQAMSIFCLLQQSMNSLPAQETCMIAQQPLVETRTPFCLSSSISSHHWHENLTPWPMDPS